MARKRHTFQDLMQILRTCTHLHMYAVFDTQHIHTHIPSFISIFYFSYRCFLLSSPFIIRLCLYYHIQHTYIHIQAQLFLLHFETECAIPDDSVIYTICTFLSIFVQQPRVMHKQMYVYPQFHTQTKALIYTQHCPNSRHYSNG